MHLRDPLLLQFFCIIKALNVQKTVYLITTHSGTVAQAFKKKRARDKTFDFLLQNTTMGEKLYIKDEIDIYLGDDFPIEKYYYLNFSLTLYDGVLEEGDGFSFSLRQTTSFSEMPRNSFVCVPDETKEGVFCITGKIFIDEETYKILHTDFMTKARLEDVIENLVVPKMIRKIILGVRDFNDIIDSILVFTKIATL